MTEAESHPLLLAISRGIDDFYRSLQQGRDVSPASQYRLEGLMQAAQLLELASEQQLQRWKQQAYRRHWGEALPEHSLGQPTELLLLMPRAPVWPSTRQ